jgi:hypothetical protein
MARTRGEEFSDPDYLFPVETIRLAEAAGCTLEQRTGSFLVYTADFQKAIV